MKKTLKDLVGGDPVYLVTKDYHRHNANSITPLTVDAVSEKYIYIQIQANSSLNEAHERDDAMETLIILNKDSNEITKCRNGNMFKVTGITVDAKCSCLFADKEEATKFMNDYDKRIYLADKLESLTYGHIEKIEMGKLEAVAALLDIDLSRFKE